MLEDAYVWLEIKSLNVNKGGKVNHPTRVIISSNSHISIVNYLLQTHVEIFNAKKVELNSSSSFKGRNRGLSEKR